MSTTVTPSPARGASGLTRASTTPGKLWLLRVGLVAACLAWGVLAALTSDQARRIELVDMANAVRPRILT